MTASIGYSALRVGSDDDATFCIVSPHVREPRAATVTDRGALVLDVGWVQIELAQFPEGVARAARLFPHKVKLATVDTLARLRSFSSMGDLAGSGSGDGESADLARRAFNAFMSDGIRRGDIQALTIRRHGRQPESEAFVRKALAASGRLGSAVSTSVERCDVLTVTSDSNPDGLANARLQVAAAEPALARYLRSAGSSGVSGATQQAGGLDIFAALHSMADLELGRLYPSTKAFSHAPVSVARDLLRAGAGEAGADVKAPSKDLPWASAADSVFLVSLADTYSLALIAAADGAPAAAKVAESVAAARRQSGDFDAFALAPLSHDTEAALAIVGSALRAGTELSHLTREELFDWSWGIAGEGLAAWLQKNGLSYRSASAVLHAMKELAPMLAASGTAAAAH